MNTNHNPICLYGASGHAKVIIDLACACNITIRCLIDDNTAIHTLQGIPVIHTIADLHLPIIISIGDNLTRRRIAEAIDCPIAPPLIHPTACVSPSAVIGSGTVIMAGAVVQAGAHIGSHCIINTGATVDHDCNIGDFVHISPGATLCGAVTIGQGTHIGAGATIIQCRTIGQWSTIGAGAAVISDIPSHTTAVGVPATPLVSKSQPQITLPDL